MASSTRPEFVSVTIASGQTVQTGDVDLGPKALVGFVLPSTFDGTTLTFQASIDGTNFFALKDPVTGSAVSYTVAASGAYTIDKAHLFIPWNYIKFVAGSAQAATDTIITATIRNLA